MTVSTVAVTAPDGTRVEVIQPANSAKVECATCSARGYPGCPWLNRHGEHERCACGRWVPRGYLGQHQGSKARHGKPCPGWTPKTGGRR